MVHLKRIETRGFKSLGSKTMSIPVERGFVSITGPNGSGKSNLLDAIIFALGENSPKTLRVPNLGALIYDGSVEEQKPSSAKVSLQFDNSDRRIPIDSDSVTISRELRQSGESVYSLNGKHIQRSNLGEVLEVALITSRGLNIVLQGMIMRISELIPDEKRKLIEQMVGVAQFDEKKNLALTQLNEADRKLEVAMAKIGEIRDRVQQLEEERNDQLRVHQLEEQVSWLRAASISGKLFRVREILEQRKTIASHSESKVRELQTQAGQILNEIESLDSERSRLIKSAMDSGAAKVELEVGKLSNEIQSVKSRIQESQNLIDNVRQILPALQQMASSQELKIQQEEQQIAFLFQKLSDAEASKGQLTEQQNQLAEERVFLDNEISAAQNKIAQLRKFKDDHDAKLLSSKDSLNKYLSELRTAEERRTSTQERIRFFEESLLSTRKSIEDLDSVLSSQESELRTLRESRSKIEKLGRKVDAQMEIALLLLQKAKEIVRDYDSEFSAMENVAGEEIAITKLDELGKTNAIDGYFGPLRSLIKYDEEYGRAIAALGKDWLDAIIVRDVQSLLRVTESAKKLKISRMTAIPLSEVGAVHDGPHDHFPGVISSTTELIHSSQSIRSVVDFVFGDSVIVDSAKSAFLMARKGFRAVTIQGDLFEPDILAFETGYSKKYLQITTLLSQQKSYEGIRNILTSLQSLIEKRKSTISELHSKSRRAVDDEHSHDIHIKVIETKLETTKEIVSHYLTNLKTLHDRSSSIDHEIDKLREGISSAQKKVVGLEMGCKKLLSLQSSIDLKSFDVRISDMNKRRTDLESKIDSSTTEIRDITTEITRHRGDLENNQKVTLERLTLQQRDSETKVNEKRLLLMEDEPKLEELEAKLAHLKEKEAETLERAAQYQPRLDALDQKLRSLKEEDEINRKSLFVAEKEYLSASNDLTRLAESEKSLFGDLTMFGYTDPIEPFEGSDELLKELQNEFGALKSNVNFNADKNYKENFENYKYSSVRKNELEKERNAIVTFIETIDSEKRRVFMDAYERIDKELRTIFTKITGGNAWLELEKPDSIFDSGVFLMAQFPGKLPRDSSSVSGGEKTMAALSFILSIQAVFPSPFYVFDEVDAHLDSVYSGKLAEILAERCAFSQIIIVSLKDTVVSKTTSVIGVYMDRGSSKVIRYKSGMEVEVRTE